jgi:ribosomal protein S18 acetylase RimI-like enzyme
MLLVYGINIHSIVCAMNSSIHAIRKATASDCFGIVAIHMLAFKRFFLTSLGPSFLLQFYHALLDDNYSIALVSESNGQITGFALGATHVKGLNARLIRRRWLQMIFSALPALLSRPPSIFRIIRMLRPQSTVRTSINLGRDRALLMSLAIHPSVQRLGIGKTLVRAFCASSRDLGCQAVELTTDANNNESVRRFYETNGFIAEGAQDLSRHRPMICYVKHLVC